MNVGDLVVLKSGGPNMTIQGVNGDFVEVVWFTKEVLETFEFPKVCLELAESDEYGKD